MTETGNTSNFNGLILEISGKALIQLYDENNQHNIAIGLPQLDHADRQVKLSQYDSVGNVVTEIYITKYNSIEIVEIRQQPATIQQESDINFKYVLSRNQSRLSGFYQSYKLEDSSIDWSKIATKITLPNTSGTFYDNSDEYIISFKIAMSPQNIESLEFRDDTGNPIADFFYSDQLSTKLQISNVCHASRLETIHGGFCVPEGITTVSPPVINGVASKAKNLGEMEDGIREYWYLCQACGVVYDCRGNNSCFADVTRTTGHTPAKVQTGQIIFIFPYTPADSNESSYGGRRCIQCQTMYDPDLVSGTVYGGNCPAALSGGHHSYNPDERLFWIEECTLPPPSTSTQTTKCYMCMWCMALYYPPGFDPTNAIQIASVCFNGAHAQYSNKSYSVTYYLDSSS